MQNNLDSNRIFASEAGNCAPIRPVSSDENLTEEAKNVSRKGEYEPLKYQPHRIWGGAKHPGLIVETPGLANVVPPPITYRPNLQHILNNKSLISAFQFERVIYAGQAHEQRLANGARAGISIGDGTGAGKTSTLAGIILDNWFQNRRKTVWFSVKTDLIEAVREEFERLGFKIPIRLINEFKPEQNILLREGIIFCTYKSLIAKSKTGERRACQIMRWLGREGIEIFDEGHRAKHAFADENGKSTQTGQAVLEIQDPLKYPEIRVVYSHMRQVKKVSY